MAPARPACIPLPICIRISTTRPPLAYQARHYPANWMGGSERSALAAPLPVPTTELRSTARQPLPPAWKVLVPAILTAAPPGSGYLSKKSIVFADGLFPALLGPSVRASHARRFGYRLRLRFLFLSAAPVRGRHYSKEAKRGQAPPGK
jgi:hypothetical protein